MYVYIYIYIVFIYIIRRWWTSGEGGGEGSLEGDVRGQEALDGRLSALHQPQRPLEHLRQNVGFSVAPAQGACVPKDESTTPRRSPSLLHLDLLFGDFPPLPLLDEW